MKNIPKSNRQISRRSFLPVLGGSLLIPFLGFGKSINPEKVISDEEYETLLKPDGTTVKIKISTLKSSKIIKKKVSNKTLLSWLKPNFKG
ncbi:MAG: hypothetical protein L3J20_00300 [Flavobacteriaceae bacterium]|nr:hypothetical protein [Flavobacteriaceae bacterium]